MRRLLLILVAMPTLYSSPSQAGVDPYNTWAISWSAEASAVPTVSEWQLLLLSLLLLVLGGRFLRAHKGLASALLVSAVGIGTVSTLLFSDAPIAGLGEVYPTLETGSCTGSTTYVVGEDPPPCFKNTCGQSVTVTLDFVEGWDGSASFTEESCDVEYYCDIDEDAPVVLDGDTVPADGAWYALPYCSFGIP